MLVHLPLPGRQDRTSPEWGKSTLLGHLSTLHETRATSFKLNELWFPDPRKVVMTRQSAQFAPTNPTITTAIIVSTTWGRTATPYFKTWEARDLSRHGGALRRPIGQEGVLYPEVKMRTVE